MSSMYFEDFEVGRRYPTYTRTITEADLVMFCALVGYHTPMFIDEHYAKKTRFGGRIVPSSLTMSFSTAMTESFFRTTIVAHLSSDKATFHAPVRPGDTAETLHARIQVAEHALYPEVLAELARAAVAAR